MATVHLARFVGPGGFARAVAIKRPHAHLAQNPEFRAMLLDEGRLAALVRHPNVVTTLDVVEDDEGLFLVMDYVPGRTLAEIVRALRARGEAMPVAMACGIVHSVLAGLDAVHETRDENGAPLGIVHRDVSPQNILVGHDGVARILDFGVAKACGRLQITREGQVKGKVAYMAPEQMRGDATPRTDVHAAAIVLWEALAGRRLWSGQDDIETFSKVLTQAVEPPSRVRAHAAGAPADELADDGVDWARLDACVLRGLARDPDARFASARQMADALAAACAIAPPSTVQVWLARTLEAPAEAEHAADTTPDAAPRDEGTLTDTADGAALLVRAEPRRSAPLAMEPARRGSVVKVLVAGLVALGALGFVFTRIHASERAEPVATHDAPAPSPSALDSATSAAHVEPVIEASSPSAPPPRSAPATVAASHGKPKAKVRPEPPRPASPVDMNRVLDARH